MKQFKENQIKNMLRKKIQKIVDENCEGCNDYAVNEICNVFKEKLKERAGTIYDKSDWNTGRQAMSEEIIKELECD